MGRLPSGLVTSCSEGMAAASRSLISTPDDHPAAACFSTHLRHRRWGVRYDFPRPDAVRVAIDPLFVSQGSPHTLGRRGHERVLRLAGLPRRLRH